MTDDDGVIEPHWICCRFRDDEILARCDASGELVVVGGLVPFAYKPGGKLYRTRADRLEKLAGAQPEVFAAPEPPKAKPKRSRGKLTAGESYEVRRSSEDAVQLWTDGACSGNPGPSGSGVLYLYRGERRELSEYLGIGTNNIAELTAILRGIELVEDAATPVDVMTDSTYCLGLLTKGWKAKANQELVEELRRAVARLKDVRILKVPGHAGVPENEKADDLATTAVATRRSFERS